MMLYTHYNYIHTADHFDEAFRSTNVIFCFSIKLDPGHFGMWLILNWINTTSEKFGNTL